MSKQGILIFCIFVPLNVIGMKKFSFKLVALLVLFFSLASCCNNEKKAKYVFYFIGDGMGFAHISLTEAYLATQEGKIGNNPLLFSQFPVMGMVTTYSANKYITCSSAAGTALSTGAKTNNYMLGVSPDSTELTSISYKIHNAGIPVGITSNVTIDHATPASFYANSVKRSDYYTIASQLAESGFEFFGGGGFNGVKDARNSEKSLYEIAQESGYVFAYGVEDYKAKKESAQKVVLFKEDSLTRNDILSYAIDREEGDLTLPDLIESAIDFLDNDEGFFIMAEGGLIDWTAHSHDLPGTIYEILDMDQAIKVAYDFYLKHPDETLIVVTADHETGGLALGYQKGSVYDLSVVPSPEDVKSTAGTNVENYMEVYPSDSLSKMAKIGWTTTSHAGDAVPLFAIGAGSERFSGRQDNTDVPKRILGAMGIEF